MPYIIPIFIPHQGCPHQCLFCNQQNIAGAGDTPHTASEVIATIDMWLNRKNPQQKKVQVAFFGGSFSCMDIAVQKKLLQQVQRYIRDGLVDSVRCSTRPDCIDPDICHFLAQQGVKTVELGVQSLTDTVLEKSNRGHNADQSVTAARFIKNAGLQLGIQLMPGLPGESCRSFLHTVDKVISLHPDFVRIYPALVVRGTGLEQLYLQGDYRPLSLNRAIALTAKGYKKFTSKGIKVIRMGLQPSITLESSVLAGPYHPSFGELVKSRLWFLDIRRKLKELKKSETLQIRVSHRDISAVVGLNKRNSKRLSALGYGGRFTLVADTSMERGGVAYVVC
jgi:histone acetyltransferase (RNA polymerase elongator complex component)